MICLNLQSAIERNQPPQDSWCCCCSGFTEIQIIYAWSDLLRASSNDLIWKTAGFIPATIFIPRSLIKLLLIILILQSVVESKQQKKIFWYVLNVCFEIQAVEKCVLPSPAVANELNFTLLMSQSLPLAHPAGFSWPPAERGGSSPFSLDLEGLH